MATISAKTGLDRDILRRLADERADEFELLRRAGRYATAVYLGGYALELLLKCAVCTSLRLQALPIELQTHDLEVLLLFSGFQAELEQAPVVHDSFLGIKSIWSRGMRYTDPAAVTGRDCDEMARWLFDSVCGIAPWLKRRI
jgi:hypothetical protein